MNMTASDTLAFLNEIKDGLNGIEGIDIAVCPTAVCIPVAAAVLADTKVGVGAQNMHWEEKGAYTGELSPTMVKEFCEYVIIGHSERRQMFGETDETVNKKAKAALANGITPIIACGESLEQNKAGETHAFVSGQIRGAFEGISAADAATCVVAYEPIWAIGTGLSADPESAGGIIRDTVRGTLAELHGNDVAQQIRIQYGGSVKPHNCAEYMPLPDMDGALVVGASLKPDFIELVKAGV